MCDKEDDLPRDIFIQAIAGGICMTKPQRIQRKRTAGWQMPENTIYVGRPSKWGNPFRIGLTEEQCLASVEGCIQFNHAVRRLGLIGGINANGATEVFRLYAEYCGLPFNPENLRGKHLACWCPSHQPCHADVLLELANREDAA